MYLKFKVAFDIALALTILESLYYLLSMTLSTTYSTLKSPKSQFKIFLDTPRKLHHQLINLWVLDRESINI